MASSQQQRIRGKYFGKKLKAKKVIELYQAGERDFQGAILRGQSFKGKDLSGANFSEADIRGTNFAKTNLKGANFAGVKCGIQKRWVIFLTITSFILAGISGYFSLSIGYFISVGFYSISKEYTSELMLGGLSAIILIITLTLIFRKGIRPIATLVVFFFAITLIGFFIMAIVEAISNFQWNEILATIISAIGISALIATLSVLGLSGTVIAVSVNILVLGTSTIIVSFLSTVGSVIFLLSLLVLDAERNFAIVPALAILFVICIVAIVGVCISWRVINGDHRDKWLRSLIIVFSTIKGTSFYSSNLIDANFIGGQFKGTDFRDANLIGIKWYGAKISDGIRPGDTYLQDLQLMQWLIGKGTKKKFDGKKLHGVNLQAANLTNASFINTDLTDANLSEAKFTGACIQDWNINSKTKLDNLTCDYVYLKSGQRERRPSDHSKNFQPGEFAKLVGKSLNTVDLIFKKGVDWKAVAYSLKNTQVLNEDTPLAIQSIENKGDGVVLIKVNVPQNADKGKIEGDFWQGYEFANKTLKEQYEARLLDKDREINRLFTIVTKKEEVQKLMAEQPKNKQIFKGNVYGVAGNVEGNQNIYTSKIEANLTEVAGSLEKLLDYFEQNDPPTTTAQQVVKIATENQPEILDAEIVQEAINSSPTLKQRLGAAGTAGYIEIVKMLVPPVGVAIEAYKAFRNPES